MTIYLEIAVNVPQVSGPQSSGGYHYHLPPELEGQIKVGHLVTVPFGQQTVQGVVLRQVDQPEFTQTRPVLDLVDPQAVVTPAQIALAQELSTRCLAPLSACIGLMLPAGLERQADVLYTPQDFTDEDLSPIQARVLKLLRERGPLRGRQIDRAIPRLNWRSAVRPLLKRGTLKSQPILPQPSVKPKTVRTVRLAVTPQEAETALADLARPGTQALQRRQAALRFLIEESQKGTGQPVEAAWIYAQSGANQDDLRTLQQRGLITFAEAHTWRDPLSQTTIQPYHTPQLTKDQEKVWAEIKRLLSLANDGIPIPPALLHGVTGSGKTEIYLHAVREILASGKQAIVLVPEIALTPQTIQRFAGRFPGQTGLLHSALSEGQRYDTWRRARAGDLPLLIGPRSALFSPLPNLGLIVVDECHDDSYYQADTIPHYHALDAAILYAGLTNALCLMGSATPDIAGFYRIQKGDACYLQLPARILAHRQTVQAQMMQLEKRLIPTNRMEIGQEESGSNLGTKLRSRYQPLDDQVEMVELPPVSIVDMRLELQSGNRSIFSRPLQQALARVLENDQQAILFLNRRGAATFVFCRDCGHTLKCPACDIPLTYHEAQAVLRCHYCNYQRNMPKDCPQCHSQRIRHYGAGVQRVEADVQELFPKARILRWDHDTTRTRGAHDIILDHFIHHRADILVGTQMLAKGLDLPLVTLVGVVLADVGLSLPDYRTNERAFHLLTQVAGRAGRSPLGGEVIFQTFQPEHYVIQTASRHDFSAFYELEIEQRRKLGYPPFTQLVRLEFRHYDSKRAESAAHQLVDQIRHWIEQENRRATRIIGPAPCFFARLGGAYRWQLVLAGPDPASLLRGRNLPDWKIEVNPPNLL